MKRNFVPKIVIFSFLFSSLSMSAQEKTFDEKINNFIEKKIEFNKQLPKGFSILLYNGNENKALDIFTDFKNEFTDIPVKISYTSPDWKVITTPYKTKVAVERAYLKIIKSFPNAKII